ncbi:MAG: DNA repair protein RecN [Oligoflexia bacterium]|nr:DNA repair protein RecN [Oligoflexia bacterium]
MLLELKVKNFAVIDELLVNFLKPGLNILTGETGAGKSVLLKSLSLLLGGKASSDIIRANQESAEIEGAFDLSARPDVKTNLKNLDLVADEDLLIIRRIISKTGKHRVYINGYLSTLNILESLVPNLIEITGQHEHHSLKQLSSQIQLLDRFAGNEKLMLHYSEKLLQFTELKEKLENLKNSVQNREQRLDFLKFQIEEIENFKPLPGEDIELDRQYQRARFSARINQFAQNTHDLLYGEVDSIHNKLSDLVRGGEPLSEIDGHLKNVVNNLKEILALAEDSAFNLRDYTKKSSESDDENLDSLQARLSDLKKLQRKYGATVEEILSFKLKAKNEYEELLGFEENVKKLESEISALNKDLWLAAEKLHTSRKTASNKLILGVNKELKDLNMKGSEFSIEVAGSDKLNSFGMSEVNFVIRPSPQDEFRAISKVASGGELSRIMLALKQVVAMSDLPMTYLFDEVDTGVSGPTAEKVGKKLKSIGRVHQAISITHLPQVAAFADAHFLISKQVKSGFVKSSISELNQKERINELGRLISGEKITNTSLAHAKQMLEASR